MCAAGEIVAGYADGCLTREQTVLVAYHRGRMAPDAGITGGLMAAAGLSAADAAARIAKEGCADVVVGCDNSPVGVTLSGEVAISVPLLAMSVSLLLGQKYVDRRKVWLSNHLL